MSTAGPALEMAVADPMNRPAPMTPAMEIIVMCLGLSPAPRWPPPGWSSCCVVGWVTGDKVHRFRRQSKSARAPSARPELPPTQVGTVSTTQHVQGDSPLDDALAVDGQPHRHGGG